jgi:hypothetical protein
MPLGPVILLAGSQVSMPGVSSTRVNLGRNLARSGFVWVSFCGALALTLVHQAGTAWLWRIS